MAQPDFPVTDLQPYVEQMNADIAALAAAVVPGRGPSSDATDHEQFPGCCDEGRRGYPIDPALVQAQATQTAANVAAWDEFGASGRVSSYCHRCHGDGELPKCPTCGTAPARTSS